MEVLLRHTVATVAYRGGKTLRGAPESFMTFRVREGSRTPVQILAHMGDFFDWALSIATGAQVWRDSTPLPWDSEVVRFFDTLLRFDNHLASDAPLACPVEQLFQGPIADALTHIGQLAMLRRLAERAHSRRELLQSRNRYRLRGIKAGCSAPGIRLT